ncbi:CBS domain-containing protein [Caenispirillum salinarum]|nr:CBS domain-containing protein [Caenispirillum salinarum]
MNVSEIMSKDVHLVDPNTTIRECAKRMRDEDIGAFPVGENDKLIGVVTDRDITVRCVAGDTDLSSATVRDAMSEGVLWCFDDDDVEKAAKSMAEHQIRRMPVINHDKRMCGVVTVADLAKAGVEHAEYIAYRDIASPSGQERKM